MLFTLAIISEGTIKPKVLVIVILVLVALFAVSTILSVRGISGNFSMKDVSPLVTQVTTRLDQPVEAHEITLAGSKQAVGCAWDENLFSIPPGATCKFTIQLSQPHWWQFNNTKRLQLQLVSPGGEVKVTLARSGKIPEDENPQVETLKNLTSEDVKLTVYDPDRQGQDWRLTLFCLWFGEENCQVELVP
jgi:hypothetical protein